MDLCRAEEAANQTGSCLPSAGQHTMELCERCQVELPEVQASWRALYTCRSQRQQQKHLTCRQHEEVPKLWPFGTHQEPMPSSGSQVPCLPSDRSFLSMYPSSGKKMVGVLKLQRTTSSRDSRTVTLDTQLVLAFQPTSMQWLPDTGSDIDAIGLNQLSFLGDFPENLKADTDIVRAANRTALHSLGRIEAVVYSIVRLHWYSCPDLLVFCARMGSSCSLLYSLSFPPFSHLATANAIPISCVRVCATNTHNTGDEA